MYVHELSDINVDNTTVSITTLESEFGRDAVGINLDT